jgi:hypothetical protein
MLRFPPFLFIHFNEFGFVSDFGFRVSDFRLRRAASIASLRFIGTSYDYKDAAKQTALIRQTLFCEAMNKIRVGKEGDPAR